MPSFTPAELNENIAKLFTRMDADWTGEFNNQKEGPHYVQLAVYLKSLHQDPRLFVKALGHGEANTPMHVKGRQIEPDKYQELAANFIKENPELMQVISQNVDQFKSIVDNNNPAPASLPIDLLLEPEFTTPPNTPPVKTVPKLQGAPVKEGLSTVQTTLTFNPPKNEMTKAEDIQPPRIPDQPTLEKHYKELGPRWGLASQMYWDKVQDEMKHKNYAEVKKMLGAGKAEVLDNILKDIDHSGKLQHTDVVAMTESLNHAAAHRQPATAMH